jgi:hypothetical protein
MELNNGVAPPTTHGALDQATGEERFSDACSQKFELATQERAATPLPGGAAMVKVGAGGGPPGAAGAGETWVRIETTHNGTRALMNLFIMGAPFPPAE